MKANWKLPMPKGGALVVGLILVVVLLFAVMIRGWPAPRNSAEFGGASIELSADRAWVLGPRGCALIKWQSEGIQSIYIDGEGKLGWGEMSWCPANNAVSPDIEITAKNGDYRILDLDIKFLPDFIFNLLGFVGVGFTAVLALYYLLYHQPDKRFRLWMMILFALCITLAGGTIRLSVTSYSITTALESLTSLLIHPYLQVAGVILAGVTFLPLAFRAMRTSRPKADLIVIGFYLVFVLMLYLPFGFAYIGQWEEWVIRGFLEGMPTVVYQVGLSIRFWAAVPHTLATIINSESFLGFHLVHILIFWGKLVLLYGIFRQLRISPLYAFLTTILFMVYPVNSELLSGRSLPNQFSVVSLLAAIYLVFNYQSNPNRLSLAGIWLGLLFNVASQETAYVIIAIVPLKWLLSSRLASWQNFNLTAIWYVIPAFKLAYLVLLSATGQSYYASDIFDKLSVLRGVGPSIFEVLTKSLFGVYRHTFIEGWQDALTALGQSSYLIYTLLMLALVGGLGWYLSLSQDSGAFPSRRQVGNALLSGLLFIVSAVGVLIWIDRYSGDPWRMYFYVPIGAAITVFSLIILATMPISNSRYRTAAIVVLCLLLMFPALSRLLLKHERLASSADNKAIVLHNVLEIAPKIGPDTHFMLVTNMTAGELRALGIFELIRGDMVNSAFYVLYTDQSPVSSYF